MDFETELHALRRQVRALRLAVVALAGSAAVVLACGAVRKPKAPEGPQHIAHLEVERIDLRESDGTLRMVMSNEARFPGLVFRGVDYPHAMGRKTAGILFYNNEGTEAGGLIYGGSREKDGVGSGASFTFDQFEQDQVVQLTQQQFNDSTWAGLMVSDVPIASEHPETRRRVETMPEGPAKEAARAELDKGFASRLFAGKNRKRDATVALADAEGRVRLRMAVSLDGNAAIEFLDESGAVTKRIDAAAVGGQ